MIKRIIYFIITVILIFSLSFPLNKYVLETNQISITFSLFSIYFFHLISAIIIYSIVEVIANFSPSQAGYAYLTAIFLKLGLFVLIFKNTIFTQENLTKPERISLVIPLFIFLTFEALAISKTLNSK